MVHSERSQFNDNGPRAGRHNGTGAARTGRCAEEEEEEVGASSGGKSNSTLDITVPVLDLSTKNFDPSTPHSRARAELDI